MGEELFVKVLRKKISYDYKKFPNKPETWDNNCKNNMLDDLIIYANESEIFRAKFQTVANIPGGRFLDTVNIGNFKIKCFVKETKNYGPSTFYGRIHGITNTYDLDGQFINENSVETVIGKNGAPIDFTKWLVHDTQKHIPEKPMTLCSYAWSAGCFITIPSNLEAMANIFDAYKYIPGEYIDGELLEVD